MESTVIVRLHGFLSSDDTMRKIYPVKFEGRMKLKTLVPKLALPVPEDGVSFFSINGVKADRESWVTNGDLIDVFPVVAGG